MKQIGGEVSRQRWRVREGGCHLRKLKVAIKKKKKKKKRKKKKRKKKKERNIDCMVLHETYCVYENVICFSYKPKAW